MKACEKLERKGIIAESEIPKCVSNLLLIPKYDSIKNDTKASKMHQPKNSINKYRLAQGFRIFNECTINVDRKLKKIKGKIVS